jgi:hypothetical protein
MLSVIVLSVIMLSVIILSVIMLSVIIPSVIMLGVTAHYYEHCHILISTLKGVQGLMP